MAKRIDYLDFFKTIGKSKRLLRSGWIREKIKDPESVAEHSFMVGVLAMVLADKLGKSLDKEKLMKMALLHDLGEVISGDVVTERWDVIDIKKRDEKEQEERGSIKGIFDKIGEANEYLEIFDEMIQKVTPESKVFWELDKLQRVIQAFEYEEEQGKNLEEFFLNFGLYYAKKPLIKEIFGKIIKGRRKEYQKSLQEKFRDRK